MTRDHLCNPYTLNVCTDMEYNSTRICIQILCFNNNISLYILAHITVLFGTMLY